MTTQPYRRSRHSGSLLHAHRVFVTKYRRPVFTAAMLNYCETIMRTVCDDLGAELAEFNGETNHIHLLVAYPPKLAISTLVQHLKGRSAYTMRREYTGTCVRARMRGHLWSPSYFAVSCGGAPLSIIQAIHQRTSPTTLTAGLCPATNGMGSPRHKWRGSRPRKRSSAT